MEKECFSCRHKVGKNVEEALNILKTGKGTPDERWELVPDLEFFCEITNKPVGQTDPICEHYIPNVYMELIGAMARKIVDDEYDKFKQSES